MERNIRSEIDAERGISRGTANNVQLKPVVKRLTINDLDICI